MTRDLQYHPDSAPEPTHYEVLGLPEDLFLLASSSGAGARDQRREEDDAPAALLRRAYRRALLRHHPDKSSPTTTTTTTASTTTQQQRQQERSSLFSVDQIRAAFALLSDPRKRAEYDRVLRLTRREAAFAATSSPTAAPGGSGAGRSQGQGQDSGQGRSECDHLFRTGIETVDLDDLVFDPSPFPPSSSIGVEPEEDGRGGGRWYRACRCGNERGFTVDEADLEAEAERGASELLVGCLDCSLWLRVHFAVVEDDDDGDGRDGDGRGDGGTESELAS